MHLIEHGGHSLLVISGRTTQSKAELIEAASKIPRDSDTSVQLMDARHVFGLHHIESAFRKAIRAFEGGDNVADSLLFETMLYMSGCRQIQESLELMGITEETGELVCIAIGASDTRNTLIEALSLEEDDQILEISNKDISEMNIEDGERKTVPHDKEMDLVLERVARVDILKR